MAKVKIEVINAVVGGKRHGETLMVEKAEADRIVERGRGRIVETKTTAKKKDEGGE